MRRFRVLLILAIASALAPLSMDLFAPSIPNATRDLGATPEALKLTIILFMAGYGVGPFLWGFMADRLGRRRAILTGLGCYLLGSLGCLLAPGVTELSAFRVLQGVGAAAGVVVARAVLRDVYGPAGATKAISTMFMILVWVPITAPLIGGLMSSLFEWRTTFLVMGLTATATWLAALLWLSETNPRQLNAEARKRDRWNEIVLHPTFLRHAQANMFCIAAMLLFLSNYSYLTERLYGFSAGLNGYVLAGFNAVISAGVYLVRLVVPRRGVEGTIQLGLWMNWLGWFALLLLAFFTPRYPALMVPCIATAGIGMGMVLSLTAGQALIPFTFAVGTASALFIFMQSGGASLINFLFGKRTEISLLYLASALALCALAALVLSKAIRRPRQKNGYAIGNGEDGR